MPKLAVKKTDSSLRSVEQGDPRFWLPATYEGTLKEMFPHIVKHPVSMETALMRALRVIVRQGVNHVATEKARRLYGDRNLICWNAFNEVYGIEPVLSRFVSSLQAASSNAEQAFQVFFLQGGPSTFKSGLANLMKRLFVESEPVLHIEGSKVHAHPLCGPAMIPALANIMAKSGKPEEVAGIRMDFLKELGLTEVLRFDNHDSKNLFASRKLEASAESMCKLTAADFTTVLVDALGQPRSVRPVVGFPDMAVYEPLMRLARTGGDVVTELKNLKIGNFRYRDGEEGAVGIATVKETEPFKFDLSEVYGEEDLQALMVKNPHPEEAVKLIGAYPVANRGIVEWVEMAKAAIQAIRSVLEVTQDRSTRYPAPYGTRALRQDLFILAHSNTPEYVKLVTTPGNEPFEDRFTRLDVLQPVRADAVRDSLKKQYRRSEFSKPDSSDEVKVEPLAYEIVADFLSATRLDLPPELKLPLLKVVDIISGAHYEPKETGTRNNVVDIMADLGQLQGRKGKTLRWADKIFGEICGRALLNGRHYVTSREVFEWMDKVITVERQFRGEDPGKDKTSAPNSELGKMHLFLRNELKKRRARRLAGMVRVALKVSLTKKQGSDMQGDLRLAYSSRYLNVAQAMQEDSSSVTADDRNFVNAIEGEMGVPSSSRETMRNQALDIRAAYTRRAREAGQIGPDEPVELPLEAFEPLRRAIDKKIAKDIPVETATSMLRSQVGDQRQGGLDTLSQLYGLTPEMAEEIAREVDEQNYFKELGDGDDY
jgi:predicted Ser/Thr protein kinase